MATYPCNILLTVGSDRMAQADPHGWTLTLISIGVVFGVLALLWGLYTLSGNIFSGKYKKMAINRKLRRRHNQQAAAATAQQEDYKRWSRAYERSTAGGYYYYGDEGGTASNEAIAAAIAMAIHLSLENLHDIEPGIITIRPQASDWNKSGFNFKKMPDIK